jgi:hypothetical protein
MIGKFSRLQVFICLLIVAHNPSTVVLCMMYRSDPDRPYSYYDLTKDAEKLLRGMPLQAENGFSKVKHWPPKKVLKDPPEAK